MLGVGADKSAIENATRQLIELFLFDSLQHSRTDLGDVGNVVEREFFSLACFAEFVAELTHVERPFVVLANIIGQERGVCYGTDGQGLGNFRFFGSRLPASDQDRRSAQSPGTGECMTAPGRTMHMPSEERVRELERRLICAG